MLLTQLREVCERCILLIEFDLPATDFHGTQLRMLKWLPVYEGRPVHNLIIPAHECEIILFGMPAQPGDKIAWANPGRGRQIPQFGGKAKPAKMIIDVIIHSALYDLVCPIAKANI